MRAPLKREFATWRAHGKGKSSARGHASRAIVKRGSTLRSHLVPAVASCRLILLASGTGSDSSRSERNIGRMSNGYSLTLGACDLDGEERYKAEIMVSIS